MTDAEIERAKKELVKSFMAMREKQLRFWENMTFAGPVKKKMNK